MPSDKTKWIFESDDRPARQRDFTDLGPEGTGFPGAAPGFGAAPTALDATRMVQVADERTRIEIAEAIPFEEELDPVVGWLVVTKGPGLGRSVNIGAGMNIVGRESGCRVSLPYGDMTISGDDHLRIVYDDVSRSFLVVPGSGKNITRLNGQVVTATLPLPSHSTLELSKKTTVRFVAFCNEDFDWGDIAPSEA